MRRKPAQSKPDNPTTPVAVTPATDRGETANGPLVLRYKLQKNTGDKFVDVEADGIFRTTDAIRVSVEANQTGFLYILQCGSSGACGTLFPSPGFASGSNRVEPRRAYLIPSDGQFVFHDPPGEEKLTVILTRNPDPDLEKSIYPAGAPHGESNRVLRAGSAPSVNADIVRQIREKLTARDLVWEKDPQRENGAKEKAVYIMNVSNAADARVVAELTLTHR